MTTSAFPSNLAFLEAELGWLRARVARLAAARDVPEAIDERPAGGRAIGPRHPVASEDARRRLARLAEREALLRREIDQRLEAHQTDPSAAALGLELLCREQNLSQDERLTLLACLVPCFGERLAQDTFLGLDDCLYVVPTVEMMLRLIDCQSTADRVRVRRIFDAEAPLLAGCLIVLDYGSIDASPQDLIGSRVHLTQRAYRSIVGEAGSAA